MKRLAAAFVALPLVAADASATGTVDCVSAESDASLSLTVGSLPVLAVVGAFIEAGGQNWAIGGEGDGAIIVGQAFAEHGEMHIDFTDPNVERVVAKLRLFSATEADDTAMAGVLQIAGTGAWAVSCIGP